MVLRLQGTFLLEHEGNPVRVSSPAQQILALLVLAEGEPVRRETLSGKVWPEAPTSRSRFYLRRVLLELNALPVASALSINPDSIALNAEEIECRLGSLLSCLNRQRDSIRLDHLDREHLSLPFLEGVDASWLMAARVELSHRLAQGLLSASHGRMLRGSPDEAVELLDVAILLEPYREQLWRALFRALAGAGDQAEIPGRFKEMRRRLANDLDLAPSAETDALVESLLKTPASSAQSLSGKKPPLAGEPFVGREDTVSELESFSNKRFVTIVGVGGIGKTRLASFMAERQEGGVFWFSTVASGGTPVIAMVAEAFGTTDQEGVVLQRLRHYSALFVFDNAEDTTAEDRRFLEALLQMCPGIRILATSRELLRVSGEHGFQIGPVEASRTQAGEPSDASRLLCAYLPRPNWKLSEPEIACVQSICDYLGGVPLALKLAALKTRSLTLERVLGGLKQDVRLLDGKTRPEKSIVEAYAWTSTRLTPEARKLFGLLSLVEFGWRDSLVSGVGASEEELEELVLAGMVFFSEDGSYRSVNPLRRLAFQELHGNPEAEREARRQLVACFESWSLESSSLDGALREPGMRFAAEELLTSDLEGDFRRGIKVAETLVGIWEERSEYASAAAWLDRFVLPRLAEDELDGSYLLFCRGRYAAELYDLSHAISFFERGLRLVANSDPGTELEFRFRLEYASAFANREAWKEAEREANLAIAIGQRLGNEVLTAKAMQCRAYVAGEQRDFETAHGFLKEILRILLASGDAELFVSARETLAVTLLNEGRLDEAEVVFKDCDSRRLRAGQEQKRHWLLNCLGDIANKRNDYRSAIEYGDEALSILSAYGHDQTRIYSLQNQAFAYAKMGEDSKAIQLLEEVLKITETAGMDTTRLLNLTRIIEILERRGDIHTARAYLTLAEEVAPNVSSEDLIRDLERVRLRLSP